MFGTSLFAPCFQRLRHVAGVALGAALAVTTASPSQAITAYELDVLRDNPIFYYTFNEASGTAQTAVNATAGSALAPNGAATRDSHTTLATGLNLGNAASFNGAGGTNFRASNWDNNPASTNLLGQLWAIEFWVQANTNAGPGQYIIEGNSNAPAIIYDFNDNKLEHFSQAGRSGTSGPTLADTNWHHVVYAYYGTGPNLWGQNGVGQLQEFYIDGVLAATSTENVAQLFELNMLTVGDNSLSANPFNGRVDELAIYNLTNHLTTPATFGDATDTNQVRAAVQNIVSHYALATQAGQSNQFVIDPVSYTYTPGNGDSGFPYEDSGGRLIDGIVGQSIPTNVDQGAMLQGGAYIGFRDATAPNLKAEIDFNLGGSFNVDEIWVDYLGPDGDAGIFSPDMIEVLFSSDGIAYGGAQSFTNFVEGDGAGIFTARRSVLDLAPTAASFVRLRVFNEGEWTFLTEVSFVGVRAAASAIPEPATFGLIAMGGLAALGRRSRRGLNA